MAADIKTGLLCWWEFNEAIGATTPDSSGNNNTGTNQNCSRVPGKIGLGASSNGSIFCLNLYNSAFPQSEFTIAFWIFSTDWTQVTQGVFDNFDGTRRHLFVRTYSSGGDTRRVQICIQDPVGGYVDAFYLTDVQVTNNVWHHLAITVKMGVNNSVSIYWNNVLAGIGTFKAGCENWVPDGQRLYLGSTNLSYAIDDFRLYNRALTAEDIAALYTYSDINTGLVALWKFDEANGNTLVDSTFYGNNGTLNGNPSRINGRIGKAIQFDCIDDYIDCGNPASLQLGTNKSWTFSAWAKVTGSGTTYDAVICGNGGAGWVKGIYLGGLTSTIADEYCRPIFQIQSGVVGEGWGASLNDTAIGAGWFHLCGVFDRSIAGAEKLYLYLNGVLVKSMGNTPAWLNGLDLTSGSNFFIGKGIYANRWHKGAIDEIRIYQRALSATEVRAIYGLAPIDLSLDLVGHWKFDETTGSFALDSSGNGNNGVIVGATRVPGKIGQGALSFDGNDYVDCGNLQWDGSFSASIWHYRTQPTNADANALFGNWNYYSHSGWVMRFYYNSPTRLNCTIEVSDGTTTTTFYEFIANVPLNTWVHVVFTWNKLTRTTMAYFQGKYYSSHVLPANFNKILASTYNLNIGYNPINAGYYRGLLDDARIYDRVLNDMEVAALYNLGQSGNFFQFF